MTILKNLRRKRALTIALTAFAVFAAGAAIACSGGGGYSTAYPTAASTAVPPPAPAGSSNSTAPDASALTIGKSSSALGAFLTGPEGNTLYVFTKDAPNTSNCDSTCTGTWPPLIAGAGQSIKADASATGTFGTISTPAGLQVTYNGAPLYHFAGDTRPGDTNGNLVGGVWFVARPDTASTAILGVHSSADGSFLVGPTGMSLYVFAKDTTGTSNCAGACIGTWPALAVQAGMNPTAVNAASGTLGVFNRADNGNRQLTYNGRPLYYYAGNKVPGDTTGDGVGGVWSLARP